MLCQGLEVTFHWFIHLFIHFQLGEWIWPPFACWNSYICSPGRSLVRSIVLLYSYPTPLLQTFLVGLHLGWRQAYLLYRTMCACPACSPLRVFVTNGNGPLEQEDTCAWSHLQCQDKGFLCMRFSVYISWTIDEELISLNKSPGLKTKSCCRGNYMFFEIGCHGTEVKATWSISLIISICFAVKINSRTLNTIPGLN